MYSNLRNISTNILRRRSNWTDTTRGFITSTEKFNIAAQQKQAAANRFTQNFNIGKVYHGFECKDVQRIEEYNMNAIFFQHQKTQTEYLHIERDDPNNVFSIGFRTTPFNSRGTAHILEHTVLCGSEKYPIRDPFFKMLNRSLATFMNAMTGPDYTFYPFSSQNEVDYRNLQKVYMDAVFRPNLEYLDFLQEGWRLEHTELENKNSPITFKGVVYNEMKGALAETSSLFGQRFINTILPEGSYGYVSGGDPLDIPNLTHHDLKLFHEQYYHPSNARLYSYGNFPLEKNLQFCNDVYLRDYFQLDPSHSVVNPQTRWNAPRSAEITCRVDQYGNPIEKQNQIAIGVVAADITDIKETFLLHALSELMVVGPNSAFYKSLIEKNISGGYNSLTGYDNQFRDTLFVVGLKDLEEDKFQLVQKLYDETIHGIVEKGFEKDHIESVLHGLELAIKHQSPKFGMQLLFNILPLWNHNGPILEAMQVNKLLDDLKANIAKPNYLNEVVEKYFINNCHKLTMTMKPDVNFDDKFNKAEEQLLEFKVSELSSEQKEEVYNNGTLLAKTQKQIQNLDILPCLKLKEITLNKTEPPIRTLNVGHIPLQLCEANTNGVTYFKGVLNTSHLSQQHRLLLPFYNSIADKFDTQSFDYRDFDKHVSKKTSGLSFSTHIIEDLKNPKKYEQGMLITSHCLDQNLEDMSSIWLEIFKHPKFENKERLKMLLDNYLSSLTNGIVDSGHMYAIQSANSLVSTIGAEKESLGGLQHIKTMQDIVKSSDLDQIQKWVREITEQIISADHLRAAFNYAPNNADVIEKQISDFAIKLSEKHCTKASPNSLIWSDALCLPKNNVGVHVSMNIPVNFCAKAIPTVPYMHEDFSKLRVLSKFLGSKYLHPVVREQNGAYGGGAMLSTEGIFSFFSYRDPNSKITLDVFDNSSKWVKENSSLLTDQVLFESKLSLLQQMDAPVAEYLKGIDFFLHGLTYDMWKTQRQNILNVTKEDVLKVSEKYLCETAWNGKCVLGQGGDVPLEKDGEKWTVSSGPQR